jgi:hypothetical protein
MLLIAMRHRCKYTTEQLINLGIAEDTGGLSWSVPRCSHNLTEEEASGADATLLPGGRWVAHTRAGERVCSVLRDCSACSAGV